ncbi:hypothetical protein BKA70DRAFT_1506402 [Coprinopsis sp. MPI-PUGE-AT-0042]|nr:hypothetical protein BKA70DRAFT_1506402 [Coprinopsis sp. MPI-PUGE-AT-0042]
MDSFIGFDLAGIIFGAQNDPAKDETVSYDKAGSGGSFYCQASALIGIMELHGKLFSTLRSTIAARRAESYLMLTFKHVYQLSLNNAMIPGKRWHQMASSGKANSRTYLSFLSLDDAGSPSTIPSMLNLYTLAPLDIGIIKKISAVLCSQTLATLGRATPGTGMWIGQMDSWCVWLDPDSFLKIIGDMERTSTAGAGKTVLASIINDILEAHARVSAAPICVNCIYFRYSDHPKATVRGLPEIYGRPVTNLALCVRTKFVLARENINKGGNPWHLDGRLTDFFATKMAIWCPDTTQNFLRPSAKSPGVLFQVVARNQDIDPHIAKDGSRSADLWRGEEEALRECTSIHDVKGTLASLSAKIEEVYLQTWQRITGQFRTKTLLAKVFLWVVAATRSLAVDELRDALATCPDTHSFNSSRLAQEGTLMGVCRGLVTVEEENRLVHYTTKDSLERLIWFSAHKRQ